MFSLSSPLLKYCHYIASSAVAASPCPRALLWSQLLLPRIACAAAGERANGLLLLTRWDTSTSITMRPTASGTLQQWHFGAGLH